MFAHTGLFRLEFYHLADEGAPIRHLHATFGLLRMSEFAGARVLCATLLDNQ